MSKLLDQLIAETGIELHSSRYDVAAAMIERELQAKWDAGYAAAIAQEYGPTRSVPSCVCGKFEQHEAGPNCRAYGTYTKLVELSTPSAADLDAVAAEQKAKEATE